MLNRRLVFSTDASFLLSFTPPLPLCIRLPLNRRPGPLFLLSVIFSTACLAAYSAPFLAANMLPFFARVLRPSFVRRGLAAFTVLITTRGTLRNTARTTPPRNLPLCTRLPLNLLPAMLSFTASDSSQTGLFLSLTFHELMISYPLIWPEMGNRPFFIRSVSTWATFEMPRIGTEVPNPLPLLLLLLLLFLLRFTRDERLAAMFECHPKVTDIGLFWSR